MSQVVTSAAEKMAGTVLAAEIPYISVVVPIYNEEENVEELLRQLRAALESTGRPYEILAVDDGSSDGSFAKLKAAHQEDQRVRVLQLRRNFGQTPAFCAGIDRARGEWIITIDADLQNDPADIPQMLSKAEEGYDVVSGWRVKRKDGFFLRKLPSKVANWLIGRITGVALHDYGCSLKVYHRDVLKNIRLYGELHRFIPAIASSVGIRYTEMPVNHRARTAGESKYSGLIRTFTRALKVFLDLLTVRFLATFATRPIHVFGTLGLFTGAAGAAVCIYLALMKLAYNEELANRPLLMLGVLLIMLGVQFLTMGLLAEIMMRTYHETQSKPIYAIREALGDPDDPTGAPSDC